MNKLTLCLLLLTRLAWAQTNPTATVTGTATVNGNPESANVVLTLLPKSTASIAFPTSTFFGVPGASVTIPITSSTTRLQPAALQFLVSAPSTVFSALNVTAAGGATNAGKSVTCVVPTTLPANTLQQNCILAGLSTTTIPSAAQIVNVAATILASAPAGNAAITLSNFTVSNAFGNQMQSTISLPNATVIVSPLMAVVCAADSNSAPVTPVNQLEPGENLNCSVTFSSNVTADTVVTLVSSVVVDPGVTVPASVTVANGTKSTNFVISGI